MKTTGSGREESGEVVKERRGRQLLAWLDTRPMNRRHWTIFAVCAVAFMLDSFDLQLMALVAPSLIAEFSLSPQVLGLVISAGAFGMMFGSIIFGTAADYIGRRPGMQITIALFTVFTGLTALVRGIGQLSILRFIAGLGMGGFNSVDTAVMTEYMPAKRRGSIIALWAITFPLGGFLAAAIASFILPNFGWRGMFVAGAVPAVMILFVRFLIPETPRFLLSKGRVEEAEKSIAWVAREEPPKPEDYSDAATEERLPSAAERKSSLKELVSPRYRRRTILALSVWFFWDIPYFGMIFWLPTLLTEYRGLSLSTAITYVIGFQVAGIFGRIVTMPLIDTLGRKPVILIGALGAGSAHLIFGLQTELVGLMIAGYILAFFHDGGFSGIAPYAPELYPTHARGTGVGWANAAGRVAAIIAPAMVGFLIAAGGLYWVFVVFSISFFVVAVIMATIGIETKGKMLEDISGEVELAAQTGPVGSK